MSKTVKELLNIKDRDGTYANENSAYTFSPDEVKEYFGVSLNAVYSSREHSKSQQIKKAKAEKNGTVFITDKLDKLMAFDKLKEAIKRDEKNTVKISGDKEGLLSGLENILAEDKNYEIYYKEI